jgi:hypothetical protein
MEIRVHTNVSELAPIGPFWDRFLEREPNIIPPFSEWQPSLEKSGANFRVFTVHDAGETVGVACFIYTRGKKRFAVAERNLMVLPATTANLLGGAVLGISDETVSRRILEMMLQANDFDLINVGEVEVGSPMHRAAESIRGGALVGRVLRGNSIRWLIKLPPTFEEYCKSLGAQTRKKDVGKFKKAIQQPSFEVQVFHRPEQVEKFLADAEKISRMTYQWNFGQQLVNDAPTRQHFISQAEFGVMRCFLLYVDGEPRAFARGILSRGIFLWETSGYDPRYVKDSSGTSLMLWMIRDLIENTDCRVFDFGMGGNYGYKARFGNVSLTCDWLQIGQWRRPYSVLLIMLERAVNGSKNLVASLVGPDSELMKRLKRSTRRYDAGADAESRA